MLGTVHFSSVVMRDAFHMRWQSPLGPIPPHMQGPLSKFNEESHASQKEAIAQLFREVQRRMERVEGAVNEDDGVGEGPDESTYKSDSSDEAMFWGFTPWQQEQHDRG